MNADVHLDAIGSPAIPAALAMLDYVESVADLLDELAAR